MTYQNPQILYFLFAIAIPIIIHLFNIRRNKTVYFSNIKFLKNIQSEKKKRSSLKNILILISRILAISAIIFAFANPYIETEEGSKQIENTFIYIDNSFSMDDISEEGRLLDVAKEKAIAIVNQTNKTNKFWIITNDFSPKENIPKNQEEAEKYILTIKSSAISRTKKDIITKQKSIVNTSSSIFILSDFQKNSTDIDVLSKLDTSTQTILLPFERPSIKNISIDTCWTEDPINRVGNKMKINAKITNHADSEIKDIIIKLEINEQHKTQHNISLLANQTKEIELVFSIENSKLNNGLIEIIDHPITFDNKFYFSFKLDENIDVTQIYDQTPNRNISSVFSEEEIIQYTETYINQIRYEKLFEQELIIMNEIAELTDGLTNTMSDYVKKGGSLCIIPIKDANINEYNNFLSKINSDVMVRGKNNPTRISKINQKHSIFNNVFNTKQLRSDISLPTINYYYTLKNNHSTIKENIFTAETGEEFLNYYQMGKGETYLFTSPLSKDNNNFYKHALFVTSFFNMAINAEKTEHLYYTIFRDKEIHLPKSDLNNQDIFHLKSKDIDIIANYILKNNARYLLIHNQITKAGHYQLLQEDNLLNTVSFNYSRKESDISQYKINEIEEIVKENKHVSIFNPKLSTRENIESINNKTEYWKICILLCLIFILIEVLLIKTIKT